MKETLLIKHFGPLQEVQLSDIPPYVFLIGPSGSGKSTLLKVVALMRWIYKMMCILPSRWISRSTSARWGWTNT